MPRYFALVEYDGSSYHGFQRQRAEQLTIQGEIERALACIVRRPVTVTGAGRTDSGVHALGQVVSFDVDWQYRSLDLQRALNANLPHDIAILQLEITKPEFHPRFDARCRVYQYHIYNQPIRSPIRRLRSWHVTRSLDMSLMDAAAQSLIGVHDFATFGTPPQGDNTVREVFAAHWREQHDGLLIFEIAANAFLYRMVRSIVGSLKLVGDGSWSVDEFVTVFRACDRDRCGAAAPAHGLYLVSIEYNENL
ncbi:MAG: tRNA pseudouridine(38-40) synthase TruA [Chloroflexota bacterium]